MRRFGHSVGITPFLEFLGRVHDANPRNLSALPGVAAKLDAIAAMQEYILRHYDGVEVVHSFCDANGGIFDCVPIDRQPGVLKSGEAPPRTAPDVPGGREEPPAAPGGQLWEGPLDPLGNTMCAPHGTVALRRVTLERMAQFKSTREFLAGPKLACCDTHYRPAMGIVLADGGIHSYGVCTQNGIASRGCHSVLSVHKPTIDDAKRQHFSVSQVWVAGGTGSGLQSIEAGWSVQPAIRFHNDPAPFMYWTANNYVTSGGIETGDFIQTNNKWVFGAPLIPSSTVAGQQHALEIAIYLSAGRWWVFFGGTSSIHAVGYMPVSAYSGGALATQATEVSFGGEIAVQQMPNGTINYPAMGSGQLASGGFGQSAYHRDMRHYPSSGGSSHVVPTSFRRDTADGYSATSATYAAPWNRALFFGGPGSAA